MLYHSLSLKFSVWEKCKLTISDLPMQALKMEFQAYDSKGFSHYLKPKTCYLSIPFLEQFQNFMHTRYSCFEEKINLSNEGKSLNSLSEWFPKPPCLSIRTGEVFQISVVPPWLISQQGWHSHLAEVNPWLQHSRVSWTGNISTWITSPYRKWTRGVSSVTHPPRKAILTFI